MIFMICFQLIIYLVNARYQTDMGLLLYTSLICFNRLKLVDQSVVYLVFTGKQTTSIHVKYNVKSLGRGQLKYKHTRTTALVIKYRINVQEITADQQ